MNLHDKAKAILLKEEYSYQDANFLSEIPKKVLYKVMDEISGKVKTYCYLCTFTKDPTKVKDVTDDFLFSYVKKQFLREPLKIVTAYIAQEGGEDDENKHVHWHVAVKTTKPLKKDRFNYYIKKYGNIDIDKSKCNTIDEAVNYLSKTSTPIQVI